VKTPKEPKAPKAPKVEVPKEPKGTPKYLVQREARQRYSFGNTWLNAVLAGFVTDKPKLVAHGVQVKAGTQEELAALEMPALLKVVQDAIYAEVYVPEAEVVEVPAETPAETPVEAPVTAEGDTQEQA
jgi:hypothetical protein